jgi:hypothetical protein
VLVQQPGDRGGRIEVARRIVGGLPPRCRRGLADDPFDGPIVQAACGYLARVSAADGGVPFVLPSVVRTRCLVQYGERDLDGLRLAAGSAQVGH